ncbi:DUF4928 family protein [Enorma phocaeensis]|uniref:DUF4928 family protein n=1 Tax=Enorma phocaeensis TaxID=1871019 RepID=A0A921ITH2_9ACTN|nr:DUF4928 family protein [Enorma phocaeensis]HJG36595.1 DUF4928 family protein [Enorma phocaeensis]
MPYKDELDDFRFGQKVKGKGALALVVQLTRAFSKDSLPIDPADYVTGKQGQVAGLGESNLRKILADHGITRQLAKEAGRTNRGNMGLMHAYAEFINGLPEPVDFYEIENYWIACVNEYFAGQPFKLAKDSSRSVTDAVNGLLEQATRRQRENPGMKYAGTVLQHLVAAKLELLMPTIEIHGASDADDQTGRAGDFIIDDTAIHCTTAPANLLIEKCRSNIEHGLNPVIITISDRVTTARNLLEDADIGGRVEVWDLQQFLSTNVYEHGFFNSNTRKNVLSELIDNYNSIIDEFETDPSLHIEYDK